MKTIRTTALLLTALLLPGGLLLLVPMAIRTFSDWRRRQAKPVDVVAP